MKRHRPIRNESVSILASRSRIVVLMLADSLPATQDPELSSQFSKNSLCSWVRRRQVTDEVWDIGGPLSQFKATRLEEILQLSDKLFSFRHGGKALEKAVYIKQFSIEWRVSSSTLL
ncbi:hypothetical protein XENOCAPTIV_002572, partial [Xenoophorus captivus]